ncbi:cbb3-type cytochrome oxidase assembly protein CcoS [Stenotrophomonas acidaminiphila]|uniref:cbb3-type cytochrome oxidase assembly protein CcoS n=1 Tax=Stenotrophomonas TaxID=40323 RepID=UPI0013764234|nr:cbb3-type cytochrome oxidase assembly protein CcoS [Stenotrophomonas acidaminiphila]NCT86862.1 cbb3-type cytochrome oxidase assembly protein CcoS [Stenotrophomonas acidaminiphila]
MAILLMLIPISLVLLGAAVGAFVWAVKRGQFDDLDTPALDILEDNDRPAPPPAQAGDDRRGSADPARED